MKYALASERMHSEGGLLLENEDGSPMCSECRLVPVPRAPVVVSSAVLRTIEHTPARRQRTYRGRKTYTAVRADGLKVSATREAHSDFSQAEADEEALRIARCASEAQAAAGLIPLENESGSPMLGEDSTQMTTEPIYALV